MELNFVDFSCVEVDLQVEFSVFIPFSDIEVNIWFLSLLATWKSNFDLVPSSDVEVKICCVLFSDMKVNIWFSSF